MPRAQMSSVALITGLAGFLASFGLLHLGVRQMGLRYGVATVVAYGVFLLMIGTWVRYYRARSGEIGRLEAVRRKPARNTPARIEHHFGLWDLLSDIFEIFDVFEIPGLGWICLAVVILISVIIFIPELVAELVLDILLGAALYHELRQIDQRHWLPSTLHKTVFPFVFAVMLFVSAGLAAQRYAPEASSI